MQGIKYTFRFKRDYRREKSGVLGKKLDTLLMDAVALLAGGTPLPGRTFDHAVTGEWMDFRVCHLRPDLVLIYRRPGEERLELVRIGSQSELGLSARSPRTRGFVFGGCLPLPSLSQKLIRPDILH